MQSKVFDKQANFIKVLAHPLRLQIIHLLRHHTLTVSQMKTMLDASQSVISQHLKSLKIAQIIKSKREGKQIYYSIADHRILLACDSIHSLISGKPLPTVPEPIVVDPVCKMKLNPNTAVFSINYKGVRHYFCAKGCFQKFNQNPSLYIR